MRNDNDVYVDDVFDKLKQFIKRIFRLIFKVFSLFWSKKLLFLGLIVVGVAIGFFLDMIKETRYESVLQIRTFQAGTEYVYNIIDNLNQNLGDTLYLEENGFTGQELQSIEITPMANMEDLLSTFRNDDSRTLETLILNTSTQDLLTSEFFRSQYSQHKIAIRFGKNFDENTIPDFLAFLNSNPYYEDLYKLQQESYRQRITEDQNSISKIDTLITNYNGNLKQASSSGSVAAFISEQRATSVFDLLQFRNDLVKEVQTLTLQLKELKAPVTLTNKPVILEQDGLIRNKTVFVPLLFIGVFALILVLIAFYRKMKLWVQTP
ncbi:hypothetical protein LCGC14_2791420 [marine sediment metagenome]|uniref:Uncharacterized protein n=1 Tax=marine sediment metagenome TaxID=412755 RepID=A0A0F8YQC6_9ZZZZ|nr:hypothetical protein [Leeuwenhoekiella sp.]